MEYYFIANDGTHIDGYTSQLDVENDVNYCMIENPSRELLDNYIFYKIVDDELVKMSDEEFEALYPNYGVVTQTEIEVLQHENHLLKAQVNALSEEGEFQSELIAELATIVYA